MRFRRAARPERERDGLYLSSFFTSSNVVDSVHGALGFDEVVGFAGTGKGLNVTYKEGQAAVGTLQPTDHGDFERVNWLGLDDDVLLHPMVRSIREARDSGQYATERTNTGTRGNVFRACGSLATGHPFA